MWAAHLYRLEQLTLLSAQWKIPLREHGRQFFFTHIVYLFSKVFVSSLCLVGGVFDKRDEMLFLLP